jgi:hypothetical protein
VNETEPLSGDQSNFGGIWYPTFGYDINEMFISADNYVTMANLTSTKVTIVLSETSYYIKNLQSPIAKESEVIFRTLLFSFLCLELCAIFFLICKLLIIPFIEKCIVPCFKPCKKRVHPTNDPESMDQEHIQLKER